MLKYRAVFISTELTQCIALMSVSQSITDVSVKWSETWSRIIDHSQRIPVSPCKFYISLSKSCVSLKNIVSGTGLRKIERWVTETVNVVLLECMV
jgi:hypothetical protein